MLGTSALVFPLALVTDDAIWLFNIARLLTFWLTALFAWRLARDLPLSFAPSVAAGAFFAFSPIRIDQISHLSTLGTQWIPLTFLFARRFLATHSPRAAVLTGLFFSLSVLACGYHGVFFAALLPLSLIPAGLFKLPTLRRALPALVAPLALLVPAYFLHREALAPLSFSRTDADTLKFAASLETFLAANQWNRVWGPLTERFRAAPNNLFPTLTVLALAAFALRATARSPRNETSRQFLHCMIALTALSAFVCLGPEIRWMGASLAPGPFALLKAVLPIYGNIRATARAGIFVAFGLALLASAFLERLPKHKTTVTLACLAAFLLEARIAPIPTPRFTNVIDSRDPVPPAYAWLRDATQRIVLAEYPMRAASDLSRPGLHDSIYMVWSTVHRQPLVNGFAGVETPRITELRSRAGTFPDDRSLELLRGAGVTHVLVHLNGYSPTQRARLEAALKARVADFREIQRWDDVALYEVVSTLE